jgi:hypothetical protein
MWAHIAPRPVGGDRFVVPDHASKLGQTGNEIKLDRDRFQSGTFVVLSD